MLAMQIEALAPGLRVVGLLGGVGAGKSTAAAALVVALRGASAERQESRPKAALLDADAEVGRLLADPEFAPRVETAVGAGLRDPSGRIDRAALGRKIFADPQAKVRLEGLLHPEVRRVLHQRMHALEASGRPAWAILDAPLLLENGLDSICDFLIFVEAPGPLRAARATARHGWTEADWRAREAAQAPLERKRAAAGAILANVDGVENLQAQARDLLPTLLRLPPQTLRERWPVWHQAPTRPER